MNVWCLASILEETSIIPNFGKPDWSSIDKDR